ncbi:hypothetical protein MUCCIDRAFT_136018 [Mucor lusitanicus CBS 277.49]|uniref:RRM domain-containing protein n=1 Tax=Mucor lusitanicus CBS 277.49 TaxID=747725 RepID=A0A168Q1Q7_MUCCL|nr:hypothetical protein MUCCIDRAFT_136018 [Mucor lusitanicus CBS 277.49]
MPSSPPLSSQQQQQDDVTTIFVVGFPDDMQEREFQNMFVFAKGFEAASLKWHCKDQQDDQDFYSILSNLSKKQMIGFARFSTRQEAKDAAMAMNGKRVDVEKGCILKAEMAKKNLHIKRNSIVPSASAINSNSLMPSAVLLPEPASASTAPMSIMSRRLSQPQIQHNDLFPTSQPSATAGAGYESFSPLPSDLLISAGSFRPTNSPADQNPPCNTLYVGNLPPATSEDELRSLFSTCEGYKRMCFRQKPQGPMCFVEFEDVVYATQAMSQHQGHVLSNSVKGGIRLSFSKNPLFIKPNKDMNSTAFSFKQMGTALLADL